MENASDHAFLSVAVLSLDSEEREAPAFLKSGLGRAAACGVRLVALPFGFPACEGAEARRLLSALACEYRLYLAAGFPEAGKRIAAIVSPEGEWLGEYAQTHRFPCETFETGDAIRPIATPLGRIGLSVGSDLYFPETHWSLVQQGADFLVHLDGVSWVSDHFYSVLSPKVRALDLHRPFLLARPNSRAIKLVHNEELQIPGTPMSGSVVYDQNGAVLASTGYSQGVAIADLRLAQHCVSLERLANVPMTRGNDLYKLYFNDSRRRFFGALRQPYAPAPRPSYAKRQIRVALLSHAYAVQVGGPDGILSTLLEEACRHRPDIVVTTEMEAGCDPGQPVVARALQQMAERTAAAGAYLLVGGVRAKAAEGERLTSTGWLWDREGRRVFESRIMLFGQGCGQGVYDTDFGRIGIRLCGDVYAPELSRLLALQGAEVVFNPSMSWGASGLINTELNQVRAMDNGHFVVSVHLAFSDPGQRSHVIDPNGAVVAASPYYGNKVLIADIDLDTPRGVFLPKGQREVAPGSYLEGYRSGTTHELLPQEEWLRLRRPELYEGLDGDLPDHPFITRDRGDGGGPC